MNTAQQNITDVAIKVRASDKLDLDTKNNYLKFLRELYKLWYYDNNLRYSYPKYQIEEVEKKYGITLADISSISQTYPK